jgi:hypothetical protein
VNDDEDDDLAEVIRLPRAFGRDRNALEAKLDELPVRTKERDYSKPAPCKHRASVVDEQARTVECRRCGAELDPIVVLAQLAKHRETLVRQGSMLQHQVDSLLETARKLERAERNAKARIRSARKRAPDDGAVEAAARAVFEARAAIPWSSLDPRRQAEERARVLPALEAYASYEPDASAVEVS